MNININKIIVVIISNILIIIIIDIFYSLLIIAKNLNSIFNSNIHISNN